jgi:hypothetical protein
MYNALKDPYRAAPENKIPVPLPHETTRASPMAEKILDELDDPIREVLKECGVKVVFHMRAERLWQRGFPERAKDTVIITTHDTDAVRWKAAAQCVFEIVQERASPAGLQMRVEIRNPELMYNDESEIVRRDTPALRTFQLIEPYVEAQVEKHSVQWTSIAYHNRHRRFQSTPLTPTVIIFVRPGSRHIWSLVEEQIRKEIVSVSVPDDVEVNVEILPGFITLCASMNQEPTKAKLLDIDYLSAIPTNGASISTELDSKAAESLGPVVFYQADGEVERTKCFLTCYHVIESGDPQGRRTNKDKGIGLEGRKVFRQITVEHPAKYDAEHTRAIVSAQLAAGQDPNSRNTRTLQILDRFAAAKGLGNVKHASGHWVNEANRRMDWALVALKSPGPGDDMQNKPALAKDIPLPFLEGLQFLYNPEPKDTIKTLGSIFKDDVVVKTGRSTRATVGQVNQMRRKIDWGKGVTSHEIEVKSLASGQPFASGGDSGSMVYNLKFQWVGLLFGADVYADMGYVTPAEDIANDIKEKTGGTITLV